MKELVGHHAKMLRETRFESVGHRQVSHLKRIGTPEAIKALVLDGLAHEDDDISAYAATMISKLGEPAVNVVIEHGVPHALPEVRGLSAQVLSDLDDKRAVPHLKRLLKDEDADVAATAHAAIDSIEGREVKKPYEYRKLYEKP